MQRGGCGRGRLGVGWCRSAHEQFAWHVCELVLGVNLGVSRMICHLRTESGIQNSFTPVYSV